MGKHKKLILGLAAGWLLAMVFPPQKVIHRKSQG